MIDKALIDYLKIMHGSYNFIVALFFAYHGLLGWKIRRERKTGGARDFKIIKRHRTGGPIFILLGLLGYLTGLALVYIDKGHLLEYPRHLLVGSLMVFLMALAFFTAGRIKGNESSWRAAHFVIGLIILHLFGIQVSIGLNIIL